MNSQIRTALIIPFYNETKRWSANYWNEFQSPEIQLIFVNDGSSDDTLRLLKSVENAEVLNLGINVGKANALRSGMLFAGLQLDEYSYIAFMDADGAFSPSEIKNLLHLAPKILQKEYDSIWSSRVKLSGRAILRNSHRHYIGRIVSTFLSTAYSNLPYDSQSGFKIYKADEKFLESLTPLFTTRWFFDLENFVNYAKTNGEPLRVWEEPLQNWKDIEGSKIFGSNFFSLAREILLVWISLRRLKRINADN